MLNCLHREGSASRLGFSLCCCFNCLSPLRYVRRRGLRFGAGECSAAEVLRLRWSLRLSGLRRGGRAGGISCSRIFWVVFRDRFQILDLVWLLSICEWEGRSGSSGLSAVRCSGLGRHSARDGDSRLSLVRRARGLSLLARCVLVDLITTAVGCGLEHAGGWCSGSVANSRKV